jgi:hypothetical protein
MEYFEYVESLKLNVYIRTSIFQICSYHQSFQQKTD